jgi:NAD(P)-dependent dehydrogenase (short-subunit alcohol dehydrogenase family)
MLASNGRGGIEVADRGAVVVIGGTSGIGREVAKRYADAGRRVILSGRDEDRAAATAAELGGDTAGVAVDLSVPETIAPALADIGAVDYLVIAAIERDANKIREFDFARATRLVTLKLVGYAEVVHALHDRFHERSAVVLFGGLAMVRPYIGSTTVTTVNGGVSSMIRTLALELAPVRFNTLHPGIVGDTPTWAGNDAKLAEVLARTPTGRLVKTEDIVGATAFLLENEAVNGINLEVDGGWMLM